MIIKNIQLLKTPCTPWDFKKDKDPTDLLMILKDELFKTKGVGLSAIQIGVSKNIFIIRIEDQIKEFINAKIVNESNDKVKLDEGCLSFPDIIIQVKRPSSIRVRYQNRKEETQTNKYEGMTARIIQHEIDHQNGILFFDRAGKYHRDKAMKKIMKGS